MHFLFGSLTALCALLNPGVLAAISNFNVLGLSIATIFGSSPLIPLLLTALAGAIAYEITYNLAWQAVLYLVRGAFNLLRGAASVLFESCFGANSSEDSECCSGLDNDDDSGCCVSSGIDSDSGCCTDISIGDSCFSFSSNEGSCCGLGGSSYGRMNEDMPAAPPPSKQPYQTNVPAHHNGPLTSTQAAYPVVGYNSPTCA